MDGELCVIWSIEHTAWLAPNARGYTRDLNQAGVYTQARAREIVKDANIVEFHECSIPLSCTGEAAIRWESHMRTYHLELTDGTERGVKADNVEVQQGALVFLNAKGEPAVAYGAGTWKLCELESRDDRG